MAANPSESAKAATVRGSLCRVTSMDRGISSIHCTGGPESPGTARESVPKAAASAAAGATRLSLRQPRTPAAADNSEKSASRLMRK